MKGLDTEVRKVVERISLERKWGVWFRHSKFGIPIVYPNGVVE